MSGNSAISLQFSRVIAMFVSIAIALASSVFAQTVTVNGFVTDATDGRALEGAAVALYEVTGGDPVLRYGAATSGEGFYLISRIQPARYLLSISFVGYRTYRDTLDLATPSSITVTVALAPDPGELDEVLVETERTSGAARVTAGAQRIRPEDVELIPAPDLSADLANYLTTLPGIVTTGDRGGQFFVRGGEPSQNLVALDGIIVYQPFHLLGFYSIFPADIIDRVDFYAGGFGAEYAGRLSSVIDVSARAGNNRRFAGMASASPFTGALRLEGPIVPRRASFLVSARESLIDQTGASIYGEELPFQFRDLFGKIQYTPGPRHRFSATGFGSSDRGALVKDLAGVEDQEMRWTNDGFGARWLMLSRNLPIATELTYSLSSHRMEQLSPGDSTLRSTRIRNSRLALKATFSEGSFFGGRSTTAAGWDVVFARSTNDLGGLFQNIDRTRTSAPEFGLYVEPEFRFGAGWRVAPSLRAETYNVRFAPYLEPRLRLEWERGIHHASGAVGLYRQQLVGLNDRRDAASVFTAWTSIPRQDDAVEERIGDEVLRGRIGRALHALLGYRSTPFVGLEYSIEGFYKRYTNLFVGEWTAFPRFTTRMQPATGRSFGFEVRVEGRKGPFYGFLTYGFSNTVYAAGAEAIALWFGTERLRYRPAHDRRHQVNGLLSASLRGIDVSLRWQFGSGLPYTRPLAFDGFALVDDIRSGFDLEHSRRVIYERPFDSILPTYHRLDVSIEKTWRGRHAALTLQASAINAYDRRNIFYVDVFTLQRKDQLPFLPSVGLKAAFE